MIRPAAALPALAWALLILVLCLLPGKDLPDWSWMDLFSLDKPVHALLFAVLTVLIPRAWNIADTDGRRAMRVYWTAAVMATAYGVSTEWMQHAFVPDRTADVNDMIANALGALLGVVYLKRRDGARNSTKGRKDV